MDYPLQVYKAGRPNMVFSVDAHFGASEDQPLSIFAGWARFVLTLIDKRGNQTKTPFCNIPMGTFEIIEERVRKLCDRSFQESFKPAPAATADIDSGILEDLNQKVPFGTTVKAELVSSGGYKSIDSLIARYKPGEERYAINRYAISSLNRLKAKGEQVITEALTKIMSGGANDEPEVSRIVVYEAIRPLVSRKPHANGDTFCYEVSMSYNPAMTNKWVIEIKNFFAPVKTNENGTKNVVASSKHDVTESKIALSDDEILAAINSMSRAKRAYECCVFPQQLKKAQAAYDSARKGEVN